MKGEKTMAQQSEAQVRKEVKDALVAAYNVLKRFAGEKDRIDQDLCRKIGHVFHKADVKTDVPLRKLNELLTAILERLLFHGGQKVAAEVFQKVERAIESTGAATFFEDNVAAEKTETP